MELNDELEEIFDIKDIKPEHLQDEKTGPRLLSFRWN